MNPTNKGSKKGLKKRDLWHFITINRAFSRIFSFEIPPLSVKWLYLPRNGGYALKGLEEHIYQNGRSSSAFPGADVNEGWGAAPKAGAAGAAGATGCWNPPCGA